MGSRNGTDCAMKHPRTLLLVGALAFAFLAGCEDQGDGVTIAGPSRMAAKAAPSRSTSAAQQPGRTGASSAPALAVTKHSADPESSRIQAASRG